jgi:hypothetical protein
MLTLPRGSRLFIATSPAQRAAMTDVQPCSAANARAVTPLRRHSATSLDHRFCSLLTRVHARDLHGHRPRRNSPARGASQGAYARGSRRAMKSVACRVVEPRELPGFHRAQGRVGRPVWPRILQYAGEASHDLAGPLHDPVNNCGNCPRRIAIWIIRPTNSSARVQRHRAPRSRPF